MDAIRGSSLFGNFSSALPHTDPHYATQRSARPLSERSKAIDTLSYGSFAWHNAWARMQRAIFCAAGGVESFIELAQTGPKQLRSQIMFALWNVRNISVTTPIIPSVATSNGGHLQQRPSVPRNLSDLFLF